MEMLPIWRFQIDFTVESENEFTFFAGIHGGICVYSSVVKPTPSSYGRTLKIHGFETEEAEFQMLENRSQDFAIEGSREGCYGFGTLKKMKKSEGF